MVWRSPASRRICGASICSIQRDTTKAYVDELQDQRAQFAADLGIKGIRVDTVQPPTLHREARTTPTCSTRLVKTWDYGASNTLATTASTSTWEFEPGFAFNKPSDVQRVLDKLQHPQFRRALRHLPRPDDRRRRCARQEGKQEIAEAAARIEFINKLSPAGSTTSTSSTATTTCHKNRGRDATRPARTRLSARAMLDFDALVPVVGQGED